jgi:hypothetical protein
MHLLVASLLLVAPVGGPVTRAFDVGPNPFAGGQHRGADLAAPPGATVRAPCGGPVVVAGRVGSSGGVVTVLCRRWRVTVMPLRSIAVRRGATVRPHARLGTLARSSAHAGLHLGVRRDGVRFGYVDPLRFLAAPRSAPFVAPPPRPTSPRRAPPRAAPFVPSRTPAPGVAPWPAFAGLGLVLFGVGVRWHLRVRAAWRRRTSTAAG